MPDTTIPHVPTTSPSPLDTVPTLTREPGAADPVSDSHCKKVPGAGVTDASGVDLRLGGSGTLPHTASDTRSELEPAQTPDLGVARFVLLVTGTSGLWAAGVMQLFGISFLLPVVVRDFGIPSGDAQWVVTVFNIVWGSFALVSARIGDIYGIRRTYLFGTTFYSTSLLIATFMPSLIPLIVFRGIAALGFAFCSTANVGIIGAHIPAGKQRTRAFVCFAGAGATGAALGCLTGGLLGATRFTWRAHSLLSAVVMLYPILIGWFFVPPDQPHPTDTSIDWAGAGLVTSAQIALTLALSLGETRGWSKPYIPILFILAPSLLGIFTYHQRRLDRRSINSEGKSTPPLIPPRLFRTPRLGALCALYAAAVLAWAAGDNLTTLGSFYYADVLGLLPIQGAYRVLPAVAGGLATAVIVGILVGRVRPGPLFSVCFVLSGGCALILALKPRSSAYWQVDLWCWLLLAPAQDSIACAGNMIVSAQAAKADQAIATSILLTFMRFGAALGLTVVMLLKSAMAQKHLTGVALDGDGNGLTAPPSPEDLAGAAERGIKVAAWFCFAALISGGVISVIGIRGWLGTRPDVEREHVRDAAESGETANATRSDANAKAEAEKAGTYPMSRAAADGASATN